MVHLKPQTTRVEIVATDPSGAFQRGTWADLPISPNTMLSVAKRIEAGSSFSHAGLAGPGRPLNRSQYETLRDEFVKRGFAFWRDPTCHNRGVDLTLAGKSVIKYYAALPQNGRESRTGTTFAEGDAYTHTRIQAGGRDEK
jgi:hypothetical protein